MDTVIGSAVLLGLAVGVVAGLWPYRLTLLKLLPPGSGNSTRLLPIARFLPINGVMDTVYTESYGRNVYWCLDPRMTYGSLVCKHSDTVEYVRIDHRAGPGMFADNYSGQVCTKCGYILSEHRTN